MILRRALTALLATSLVLVSSVKAQAQNSGAQLGSYQNVIAYSNGPHTPPSGDGLGFYQCVEYVKRFYNAHYGIGSSVNWHQNAKDYFGAASSFGLFAYPNGGTYAPQQGDIMCFSGGTYGHVAIVTTVTASTVSLIEQNWSRSTCFGSVSIASGSTFTVHDRGSYKIQGWLRLPNVGSILYRYHNPSNDDHLYTTTFSELGNGTGSWLKEANMGLVYTSAFPGMSRVYRYVNDSIGQHFFTTNYNEIGDGSKYGYRLDSATFYVFGSNPNPSSGTAFAQPMYRYRNNKTGGHFYTLNWSELGNGAGPWAYESIAWWQPTR